MPSLLTLYYKDDFVTIEHDPENKWIITSRTGYPDVNKVKLSLLKTLELIQDKHYQKIISDMRGIKGTWTSTNDWIAQEWMPKALKAGLKYVAYIYPPDIFGQFALKDLIRKNDLYILQIFNNMDDAEKWLREVE